MNNSLATGPTTTNGGGNTGIIVGLIVVLVLGIVGYFIYKSAKDEENRVACETDVWKTWENDACVTDQVIKDEHDCGVRVEPWMGWNSTTKTCDVVDKEAKDQHDCENKTEVWYAWDDTEKACVTNEDMKDCLEGKSFNTWENGGCVTSESYTEAQTSSGVASSDESERLLCEDAGNTWDDGSCTLSQINEWKQQAKNDKILLNTYIDNLGGMDTVTLKDLNDGESPEVFYNELKAESDDIVAIVNDSPDRMVLHGESIMRGHDASMTQAQELDVKIRAYRSRITIGHRWGCDQASCRNPRQSPSSPRRSPNIRWNCRFSYGSRRTRPSSRRTRPSSI